MKFILSSTLIKLILLIFEKEKLYFLSKKLIERFFYQKKIIQKNIKIFDIFNNKNKAKYYFYYISYLLFY